MNSPKPIVMPPLGLAPQPSVAVLQAPLTHRDRVIAAFRHQAVEIRIGDVPLPAKLDAIAAALQAVREAHRSEMPAACWAAINRACEELAAATVAAR